MFPLSRSGTHSQELLGKNSKKWEGGRGTLTGGTGGPSTCDDSGALSGWTYLPTLLPVWASSSCSIVSLPGDAQHPQSQWRHTPPESDVGNSGDSSSLSRGDRQPVVGDVGNVDPNTDEKRNQRWVTAPAPTGGPAVTFSLITHIQVGKDMNVVALLDTGATISIIEARVYW